MHSPCSSLAKKKDLKSTLIICLCNLLICTNQVILTLRYCSNLEGEWFTAENWSSGQTSDWHVLYSNAKPLHIPGSAGTAKMSQQHLMNCTRGRGMGEWCIMSQIWQQWVGLNLMTPLQNADNTPFFALMLYFYLTINY